MNRGRAISTTISLCLVASQSHALWDAAADFRSVNNPSGEWEYGYEPGKLALLLPMAAPLVLGEGLVGWQADTGEPWIVKNMNETTRTVGSAHLLAGQIAMRPGGVGPYVALQFTAPTAGMYSWTASFTQRNTLPSSSDVYIVHNGTTLLWSGLSNSFDVPVPTSGSVKLEAGDRLSAVVGPDGSDLNDVTGVDFTIDSVPEPTSSTILGLGLAALLRRRKGNLRLGQKLDTDAERASQP